MARSDFNGIKADETKPALGAGQRVTCASSTPQTHRLICGATRSMLRHPTITDSPEVPSMPTSTALENGDGTDEYTRREDDENLNQSHWSKHRRVAARKWTRPFTNTCVPPLANSPLGL